VIVRRWSVTRGCASIGGGKEKAGAFGGRVCWGIRSLPLPLPRSSATVFGNGIGIGYGRYPERRPAKWTAELQLGIESLRGSGAWSVSWGYPERRPAMWTAELQLGIESWWGFGAWSCSGGCSGRYPERRPSGLPPPHGVVAQRRPIRAVSVGGRESNDRPARASGGLPACFDDAPWVRSPWIAKHAHCAQRASGREVDGGHNGVHGTSRPMRWGARVGEVLDAGAPGMLFGAGGPIWWALAHRGCLVAWKLPLMLSSATATATATVTDSDSDTETGSVTGLGYGRYPQHRPSGSTPPAGSATPRTAELQLGIESWWGTGGWLGSGGFPVRRPSGSTPPHGVDDPASPDQGGQRWRPGEQ